MSRAQALPLQASEQGRVDSLTDAGAGVVHAGKTVFVPGALPGEQVRFIRRRRHRQYDEADLQEILSASEDRVTPRCAHVNVCGGCALQHLQAAAQLRLKQQQLLENLQRLARVQPQRWLEPVTAPEWHYRRRARLGVKYVARKGRVLVGFRERSSGLVAAIERCEVLVEPVGALIGSLATLIDTLSIRDRVPQVEVATGEGATALVLRVLQPPSAEDLLRLREFAARHGVHWLLQPAGVDSVYALEGTPPTLSYQVPAAPPGRQLQLQFLATDFVQVNAAANRLLVERAADLLQLDGTSRVLDLYCGIGNFSLPLATRAHSVVGIEGDRGLVERARANARANGIENAVFHVADLSADLQGAAWMRGPASHVLLDPPRLGARSLLPQLARLAPQRLLYVSCHPATLARDVGVLVHEHGFELLAAGVVDMFAHTAHVESLALLSSPT